MAVRTTCPYCGVGCGVLGAQGVNTQSDEGHPANAGKLCSKGSALHETLGLSGRLLTPKINGADADWDRAIHEVARKFRQCIDQYGPDSVAFYVSGQILTEDYYLANKLMKGFIGSGNIDTNSRLCMASAVVAHTLAFGEDVVPASYGDLDIADLIVFAGHNAAWTHPVLHRRMEAQRERGQFHIVIDPRQTDTAVSADLHLAIRPQTDIRLWNGLAAFLIEHGGIDRDYIGAHTRGLEDLKLVLLRDDQSIDAIAADCGLTGQDVAHFYRRFLTTAKTTSLFSQGLNQSTQGVNNGLAVINAHLLTGRVSRPGASPFSITGQPNAMGGRETGGMASALAAHLSFTDADREKAARFWNVASVAPKPGLKAVDMFEAVLDGRIKALWVMATNPALSLPDSNKIERALKACEFLVVSDVMAKTETMAHAHVALPALAWGEKDGTVTNSERRISRQRPFLPAPGQARADWSVIASVARAMGYDHGFDQKSASEVFVEYAVMTNFENQGQRVLDLGHLAELTPDQYDALEPVQWPVGHDRGRALHPYKSGHFSHPDGKAKLIGVPWTPQHDSPTAEFPLILNTGRLRDQWHTMTRTGLANRLMRHAPEPVVDINPHDAQKLGILDGCLCSVETQYGRALVKARVFSGQRLGDVFVPMHFSDAFAPMARANRLTNPDRDPKSGQPAFKATPAKLRPVEETWRGFFVAVHRHDPPETVWWARTPELQGHLYEMSGLIDGAGLLECARQLKNNFSTFDLIEAQDSAGRFARFAVLQDGILVAAFAGTTQKGLPQRSWMVEQLGQYLDDEARMQLLVGRPAVGTGVAERGKTICACFDVTLPQIQAFAELHPHANVNDIGGSLKAGTNCGSCRGEIASVLAALRNKPVLEVGNVAV